ncbi:MAG: hypothetical protein ACK4NF_04535 [Planctomycetota bacterium]
MQKVNLEMIFRFLENPACFNGEEAAKIHQYLVTLREKLLQLNIKYNLNIEMSDYVTTLLEKEHVGV